MKAERLNWVSAITYFFPLRLSASLRTHTAKVAPQQKQEVIPAQLSLTIFKRAFHENLLLSARNGGERRIRDVRRGLARTNKSFDKGQMREREDGSGTKGENGSSAVTNAKIGGPR